MMNHRRLSLLTVMALSAWLGVMAFFGFIVAPTAFSVLDREAAGRLASAVMPAYLWLGVGLGLLALAASVWRLAAGRRPGAGWPGLVLIAVAVGATVYSLLVILPEARGLTPTVRAWRLSGGPPPPEAIRFAWLHRLSTLANLAALAATAMTLAFETWKATGNPREEARR